MKNSAPNERFSLAIQAMATSPKSIQERILVVYIDYLIQLKTCELPEKIQTEFSDLHDELSRKIAHGKLVVPITDDDAIDLANKIYNMASYIHRDYYEY